LRLFELGRGFGAVAAALGDGFGQLVWGEEDRRLAVLQQGFYRRELAEAVEALVPYSGYVLLRQTKRALRGSHIPKEVFTTLHPKKNRCRPERSNFAPTGDRPAAPLPVRKGSWTAVCKTIVSALCGHPI
jgi:hypothetical protein